MSDSVGTVNAYIIGTHVIKTVMARRRRRHIIIIRRRNRGRGLMRDILKAAAEPIKQKIKQQIVNSLKQKLLGAIGIKEIPFQGIRRKK